MISQLAEVLEGKRYVLIGGIAVAINGRQRYTHDADIVITISKAELPRLVDKLNEYGFKISESYKKTFSDKLLRQKAAKILYDKDYSVDFRIESYSIDKEAIKRAIPVEIYGKKLSVATPEDIIVYKMARFSDQDRADIQGIIERHGKKLDTAYINKASDKLTEELKDETQRTYMQERLGLCLSWIEKGVPRVRSVIEVDKSQEQTQDIYKDRGARHR